MSALRTNEPIQKAVLTLRKAGKSQLEFLKITIENGRVISLTIAGGDEQGGHGVVEHVAFSFNKITVEYTPQGKDGQGTGGDGIQRSVRRRTMTAAAAAEDALRGGDPAGALALLQAEVRNKPADAGLRVFLFQLLCVLGQWERALNQLKVAADLDASALAMAQHVRRGRPLRGDARVGVRRTEVADDLRRAGPVARPADRIAARRAARATPARAEELRLRAFDDAPASTGDIDGRRFEWIADADSRLGPVLEAMINGRYYWIPFARLARRGHRGAGGPARCRLDAGPPPVRERRRDPRADPDALPRVGELRRRPHRAGAQDGVGRGRSGRASRTRAAAPRHRRRRNAPDGHQAIAIDAGVGRPDGAEQDG